MAIAAAHHRFNYIHPFPDGNGRVSRLMSHAMAHVRRNRRALVCGRFRADCRVAWHADPKGATNTRR